MILCGTAAHAVYPPAPDSASHVPLDDLRGIRYLHVMNNSALSYRSYRSYRYAARTTGRLAEHMRS
jgi:hypothetical protein